jgi:hypothetical protein
MGKPQLNKVGRARLAEYLLDNPEAKFSDAYKHLGFGPSVNTWLKPTPEAFLRAWGGDKATDERVIKVLRGPLRMQHKRNHPPLSVVQRAPVATFVPKVSIPPGTYLLATECQWPVNCPDKGFYCREPVTDLYCEVHDTLAKEQERLRFYHAHLYASSRR